MRQYGQMCNLFLNMCIVGLVEIGPAVYRLETITDTGVIRSYTVYETSYCDPTGVFLSHRRRSSGLSLG